MSYGVTAISNSAPRAPPSILNFGAEPVLIRPPRPRVTMPLNGGRSFPFCALDQRPGKGAPFTKLRCRGSGVLFLPCPFLAERISAFDHVGSVAWRIHKWIRFSGPYSSILLLQTEI